MGFGSSAWKWALSLPGAGERAVPMPPAIDVVVVDMGMVMVQATIRAVHVLCCDWAGTAAQLAAGVPLVELARQAGVQHAVQQQLAGLLQPGAAAPPAPGAAPPPAAGAALQPAAGAPQAILVFDGVRPAAKAKRAGRHEPAAAEMLQELARWEGLPEADGWLPERWLSLTAAERDAHANAGGTKRRLTTEQRRLFLRKHVQKLAVSVLAPLLVRDLTLIPAANKVLQQRGATLEQLGEQLSTALAARSGVLAVAAAMEADSCVSVVAMLLRRHSNVTVAVLSGDSDHLALGDPALANDIVMRRSQAPEAAAAAEPLFDVVRKTQLCAALGNMSFSGLVVLSL
jgi:hypothetical protein